MTREMWLLGGIKTLVDIRDHEFKVSPGHKGVFSLTLFSCAGTGLE